MTKLADDKEDKRDTVQKILEDKMKKINQTVNKLAEDKKEKVDAALKILTDKTKDIDNIKATIAKLVAEKKEKKVGINNLEEKVNDIKEILNPVIPTLGFAKECI